VPADDPPRDGGGGRSLLSRALRGITGQIEKRIPRADLDERDPDYIREQLPLMWLAASIWYRGEVRGLGNVPDDGPVLLVGNHSGGNMTPDTLVFTLAFATYFGVERAFYQLAHNLVLSMPGLGSLRKFGTVAASPSNAAKALDAGAALLVYPGGDYEVHRPIWERNRVDFDGRKGFIRLALERDVPIVPVVSIGGQDVGDMLGHIPLPAKITIETLPAINLREEFGPDPDLDEVYDKIVRSMQETLDALAAERRLPILG
jgi:1-acyl-sn-glycerol-3-phosphate acyltransferase